MISLHFKVLAFLAILASAGCSTTPQAGSAPAKAASPPSVAPDIDFVRGCWISRAEDEQEVSMLRLLPASPGGPTLEGYLQNFRGGEMLSSEYFLLARDGSQLAISAISGELKGSIPPGVFRRAQGALQFYVPPGHKSMAFTSALGDANPRTVYISGDTDSLKIGWALPMSFDSSIKLVVFAGARDGCD